MARRTLFIGSQELCDSRSIYVPILRPTALEIATIREDHFGPHCSCIASPTGGRHRRERVNHVRLFIGLVSSRARNEASFGGIASLRLDYLPPRFASPRPNLQNLASPRLASSNFRIASLRLASDLRDQLAFIKFRVFFIIFDSMLSWYSPHIISRSSEISFINFGCKEKLENHCFGRIV